jgi:hypothetical protein
VSFIPASFVKPDGCVRFVQFSFGVVISVYFYGFFGVYKFNTHDNGRSPHAYVNQRLQIQFRAPDYERYAARNMLSLQ